VQTEPAGPFRSDPAIRASAMLLLAAFFWGSGNLANKTVLQDLDPFTVVVLRNLVAALAIAPMLLTERAHGAMTAWFRSALPVGVFFGVAVICQQWGYQTATVTNASFLVNATCVLTPILAWLMFDERPGQTTVLAAVVMLFGALSMSGVLWTWQPMNVGDAWCLVSALFYSVWMILLVRHVTRHGRPVLTTLVQCMCAACIALPFSLSAVPELERNFIGALPELFYLGVFSTALAFGLASVAQRCLSASVGAILMSSESLFGAAGGILVLGERPDFGVVLGATLMMTAILLVCRPSQSARGDQLQPISKPQ
jgi:drug/metabolite transporter (DMT)-like permease